MGFAEVVNDQACLKAGIMGLQGGGKSYTGAKILIGLHGLLRERRIIDPEMPVYMLDTETGSTWLKKMFNAEGIKFQADRSRAFKSLIEGVKFVNNQKGLLLIDSITHFWRELCEAYAKKVNRRRLTFQDWGTIKSMWSEFTDLYVSGAAHVVMCGRQGYEYDMYEEEDGKKQIEKTGLKMKAEAETGYEPNLLIVMERHQLLGTNGAIERVWRTAYVLKDRADEIDGKSFSDPDFTAFLPHINHLNLGGEHVGIDTTVSSESMIPRDDNAWRYEKEQRDILLEEIQGIMVRHYPSTTAADKKAKAELIPEIFATDSWTKVTTLSIPDLKAGYARMHQKLEGRPPADAPQPVPASENPF